MIKTLFISMMMIVISAFCCKADDATSLFENTFSGYKTKVKGNKIRGQKLKGSYDGLAVINFKNGDIYFGDVNEGQPNGKGIYVCKTGNFIKNCDKSVVFIGRFKKGLKHNGVCLNPESEVLYEGAFTEDTPGSTYPSTHDVEYTGYFDAISSDNDDWKYVGEISQGTPDGLGIILFNNKDFLISNFVDGSRIGIGLLVSSDGEWQTEKAKGDNISVISSSTYYAKIDAERSQVTRAALGQALGYFVQAVNQVGQITSIASGQTPVTISGASSEFQSISSDNSSSKSPSGNYQSDYDRWARLAEGHYNSITKLGYSVSSKNGEKKHGSAGQGMSGGNYVSMKKSFREAQRQMRNIRAKAAKAGVTIIKSEWETASISY